MATLFESFTEGTGYVAVGYVYYKGQTFTPSQGHRITSVKLKLSQYSSPGKPIGTLTVDITATDADGLPTSVLCSGTIDGDSLSAAPNYVWYEITLGAGYILNSGSKYAITARAPNAYPGNSYVYWQFASDGGYSNGNQIYSNDSGSTWYNGSGDSTFEDWGIALPTVTTLDATNITYNSAELWGTLTQSTDYPSNACYFGYGKTIGMGSDISAGTFTKSTSFHATATSLEKNMVYYFYAYAQYDSNYATGSIKYFTTKWANPESQAGYVWIEGTKLHYFDSSGVEHAILGS